jgi:hypothetical protein
MNDIAQQLLEKVSPQKATCLVGNESLKQFFKVCAPAHCFA